MVDTIIFEIRDEVLFVDDMKLCIPNLYFIEEIGEGANAKVFLADNKCLHRQEAVKIWIPKKNQKVVDKNRFLGEVRKNANMHILNVATFYDAFIENGFYCARIEYIPGKTLKVLLKESPGFVVRYAILETILETMKLVYEAGFYHGDLHAKNVIINEDKPHIIDFGTSLFSGKTASKERDCRMLVELCFEVLPELQKLEFLDSDIVIGQDSKIAAEYLLQCLPIIWDFENSSTSDLDKYTYKEWEFRFDVLLEEFSFLDRDAVNKFFAGKYSKKART